IHVDSTYSNSESDINIEFSREDDISVYYKAEFPQYVEVRPGYTFMGWNLRDISLNGKTYTTVDMMVGLGEHVTLSMVKDLAKAGAVFNFDAVWEVDETEPPTDPPTDPPTEPEVEKPDSYEASLSFDLDGGYALAGEEAYYSDLDFTSSVVDGDLVQFQITLPTVTPQKDGFEFSHWYVQGSTPQMILDSEDLGDGQSGATVQRSYARSYAEEGISFSIRAIYKESGAADIEMPVDVSQKDKIFNEGVSPNGRLFQETFSSTPELPNDKQFTYYLPDQGNAYADTIWFANDTEAYPITQALGGRIDDAAVITIDGRSLFVANGHTANEDPVSYVSAVVDGAPITWTFDHAMIFDASSDVSQKIRIKDTSVGDYGTGVDKPRFFDLYWKNNTLEAALAEVTTREAIEAVHGSLAAVVDPLLAGGADQLEFLAFDDGKYAINYTIPSDQNYPDYSILFTYLPNGSLFLYSHSDNYENNVEKAISYGHYEAYTMPYGQ
ncbi:MAG: hypothetical protein Q4P72_06865, partial [Eubacteriales bacterium]|nr:hypothetical protein [Eubacteriales bacterium]